MLISGVKAKKNPEPELFFPEWGLIAGVETFAGHVQSFD